MSIILLKVSNMSIILLKAQTADNIGHNYLIIIQNDHLIQLFKCQNVLNNWKSFKIFRIISSRLNQGNLVCL